MGKKSRKLRSPKYKAKASAFRETVARLRNQRIASAKNEASAPVEEDTFTPQVNEEPPQKTPEENESEQEIEQVVTKEEPKIENGLRLIESQEKEAKVTTKRKPPRKKKAAAKKNATTTTTKKAATTTRRRRTTKTKTTA